MLPFSTWFIRRVEDFFGSEMSPRLREALREGDANFVRTFLRPSRIDPTWQLVMKENFMTLKALAAKQTLLEELREECDQVLNEQGIKSHELA